MPEYREGSYGLADVVQAGRIPAPDLPYRPREPRAYHPGIGLIGCGGISEQHLSAYQKAGYRVVALCDRHLERADRRRVQFFPEADVYTDYRRVLDRAEIEVVDLTPHPHDRTMLIDDSLRAGKHVLSQKPFVHDLDDGERLVELARRHGVYLAVNQNGRWAPHFSYMRQAGQRGLIGEVAAIHLSVHWNHQWIAGTKFEEIQPLILFDFGIHWFDIVHCLMTKRQPRRVFASAIRAAGQIVRPPMLAEVIIEYDDAQASIVFDGDTRFGPRDHSFVVGTKGTIRSHGVDLQHQTLTLTTEAGESVPDLQGKWFPDGFHGTMAELLCAIEERREPLNSARDNLASLALCFAGAASADRRMAVEVGTVRRIHL